MQPYQKSEAISTETAKILTAVRSQCLKGIRHNFSKMYKKSLKGPLQCNLSSPQEDTQEHLLSCMKLGEGSQLMLDDIFFCRN